MLSCSSRHTLRPPAAFTNLTHPQPPPQAGASVAALLRLQSPKLCKSIFALSSFIFALSSRYRPQLSRSSERYVMASEMCSGSISALPSKSAIVRATLMMRS